MPKNYLKNLKLWLCKLEQCGRNINPYIYTSKNLEIYEKWLWGNEKVRNSIAREGSVQIWASITFVDMTGSNTGK